MHHFEFRLAIVLNSLGYFKRKSRCDASAFSLATVCFAPPRPPPAACGGGGSGLGARPLAVRGGRERDKGENKEYRVGATAYTPETTIFSSGPFKSHLRNQKSLGITDTKALFLLLCLRIQTNLFVGCNQHFLLIFI